MAEDDVKRRLLRRLTGTQEDPLPGILPPPPKVDRKVVTDWLNTKWKGALACPVCTDKTWLISEDYIYLATPPSPLQFGRQLTYPSVQLICTDCGYVMLFNWGIILHGKEKSDVQR